MRNGRMPNIRYHVFTKVVLAAGAALVLLLLGTNSAIRHRSERAGFERCRLLHQEVLEKLEGLQDRRRLATATGYDEAWNEACEMIQIVFRMSWGQFPNRVPEDAYQSLSEDLDTMIQADSSPSVILEQVWLRIGNSSPHLFRLLHEKEALFKASLARLREMENNERNQRGQAQ